MLVITQQEGEILQIGDDIRILIRRVRGGWVRIAVDAPREIPIQRIVPPMPEPLDEPGANVPAEAVIVRRRRPR